jgi:hypothetical protein
VLARLHHAPTVGGTPAKSMVRPQPYCVKATNAVHPRMTSATGAAKRTSSRHPAGITVSFSWMSRLVYWSSPGHQFPDDTGDE